MEFFGDALYVVACMSTWVLTFGILLLGLNLLFDGRESISRGVLIFLGTTSVITAIFWFCYGRIDDIRDDRRHEANICLHVDKDAVLQVYDGVAVHVEGHGIDSDMVWVCIND